jgi:hypothetical protein
MTQAEQQKAAKKFVENWNGKGYEKGEAQKFWLDLLCNVFGIQQFSSFIDFENQIKEKFTDKTITNFIDAYIPSTKIMIEQKSSGKDLRKPIKQSDGSLLTPFQQAKKYIAGLPLSQHPRWVITCNFEEFLVYDMEQPNGEPESILLENLEKEYYRLSFLTEQENIHLKREMEISIKAGDIVGLIYDKLLAQYQLAKNIDMEKCLKSLNMLCVRLVFCLYAEDAGIFGHKSMFGDYLNHFEAKDLRNALINLFKVLDQKPEDRDPFLEEELATFPYVNGGLFTEEDQFIPPFTEEIKDLLVRKASDDFNWAEISPTIFGAVFESTLNPETRRSGGMHYTSIENIHKVIDPLFMDELKEEFESIKEIKQDKTRENKLIEFQKKLGNLKFLDPACGSGNFLTETYLSLRRLENECLKLRFSFGGVLDVFEDTVFVKIHQFYGIEINDFAAVVAKTALWIAESQMMIETSNILQRNLDFLPLKSYANIVEGNALRIDWETVVSKNELNYIMGNPPFVGARLINREQREDVENLFKNWNNDGNLDYVCCWYKKAVDLINDTSIKCAFVSTSSVCQGETVANLWQPILDKGISINFAYEPFKWTSEATGQAQVWCVIIGFSCKNEMHKKIYTYKNSRKVKNINAYILDAKNVFIERRSRPLCKVPKLHKGCQPTDGGNLIIEAEEYEDFLKKEPNAKKYIKNLIGAREFLQNKNRYCLWLVGVEPAELKKMPYVIERIKKCKEMRLSANDKSTQKLADRPTEFRETYNYKNYIVIPMMTPSNKKYIPLGFYGEDTISTNLNLIVENGDLYLFGILMSSIHMAWTKVVCGRLGDAFRYSAGVVYNNFPFCNPTEKERKNIIKTAENILKARELFPNSSISDLYDDILMPPELRKAHKANDHAVMEAYGFAKDMTESEIVSELFNMYEELTK